MEFDLLEGYFYGYFQGTKFDLEEGYYSKTILSLPLFARELDLTNGNY